MKKMSSWYAFLRFDESRYRIIGMQIWIFVKNQVFKYEFLWLFIYPCLGASFSTISESARWFKLMVSPSLRASYSPILVLKSVTASSRGCSPEQGWQKHLWT